MVHQVSGITVPDLSDPANVPTDLATMAADIANLIAAVGQAAGTKPAPGLILPYAGTDQPAGYLLCDGRAVSRAAYSLLFAKVQTKYGVGDGTTTFNLPNLKGRALVGYDATQTEFNAVGKTGGAKVHTLVEAEMPRHHHTVAASTSAGGSVQLQDKQVGSTNAHPTSYAGGDKPHNNLQPYTVVTYIIATGL
jgi:microcystin-dependent protein